MSAKLVVMSFAPKQDWPGYHAFVGPKQIEKDRQLSASQKLQRYAEIFDSVWTLKTRNQNDRCFDPLEDEKLILRANQLLGFRNVPEPDCE